jgi:hypothetical protein
LHAKLKEKQMDTLNSKAIDCLKQDCSEGHGVSAYMNHIMIKVENGYNTHFEELKTEITSILHKNFPQRQEDLSFTFSKEGVPDEEFKIFKTA